MERLEGRPCILAALRARRRKFRMLLVSESVHAEKVAEVVTAAEQAGVPISRVSAEQLDAMAHGRTHGGLIAVCTDRPATTIDELIQLIDSLKEPPLLLLIEGADDSRNLGYVLRSAEAFGVHAVLVKKHLWDFDSADVSRASAGAYERLPLVRYDKDDRLYRELRKRGIRLYACVPRAKRPVYAANLAEPVLLAVGGEKRGLSGAVREECDRFIAIPMKGEGTSLSLTDAVAVVTSEAMRQRGGFTVETSASAEPDEKTGPED